MNCQECRDLFEDMLDRRVDESLRKRMDIHLLRCCDCRSELERRRAAHTRIFRALNSAKGSLRLPEGFADRLAAECRLRPQPWWRRVAALPRWALVAASLAVMAGFVFASVVAVDTFVGARSAGGDGDEADAEDVMEAEYAEPYVSSPSSDAGGGSQSESGVNEATAIKGAKAMKTRKTTIRALASAALMTAVPAAATELPWTAGAADLGGKIAITYDTVETGKVKTLVATPEDGETLTVTGDAMTFAADATISMAADGKLIFANDVTADGALALNRTDGAYDSWTATTTTISSSRGYCLRSSSGSIVFENKNYQDWELVGVFAFADAKPTRPVAAQKLGNHSAVTESDPKGVWTYTNLAGAYRRLPTAEVNANNIFYRFNRWTGEYTYSIRVILQQSAANDGRDIVATLRTGVCGRQFGRYPDLSLWHDTSDSWAKWSGWYGNDGDSKNPNYLGSPIALGVNRLVIRRNGSDVATVGFAGEVSLGGKTDVALGVRLAVLPKQSSTFAAPVFSGEGDVEYQRAATLANVNLMKYGSNLSVSNAQVTVTHSGAFPTNAVVDVWRGGVVLANVSGLSNVGGISDGWYDLNVRNGGAFRTQSSKPGGIGRYQLAEIDGGELYLGSPDATQAGDGTTSGNGRYIRLLTLMNGAVTKGRRIRVGYDANCPAYWHVCGTSPSTNDCEIGTLKGTGEFTIDVDDLADETPDFVCNGNIVAAGGPGQPTSFVKAGEGTMEMTGIISILSGYKVYVDGGTLLFGANGGFRSDSASKDVELRGGTLAKASGELACGTLAVGDAGGTLELGRNATMTFSDSSAKTWEGFLTVKGFRDRAIRVGTSDAALTEQQQRRIRIYGGARLCLLPDGYLVRQGMTIVIK